MGKTPWKVHKFGGSSLADADCFRRVAGILLDYRDARIGVVVSAMGGMTDALLNLVALARDDDNRFHAGLDAIGERYEATAAALLDGKHLTSITSQWQQDAEDIRDVLRAIALVKSAPQRSHDVVAGYGEIWSARLLAALLETLAPERGGTWIDARKLITIQPSELGPTVIWRTSRESWSAILPDDFTGIAVMTGFIASDEDGLQTTLGRNGSDFSAAILAALSHAAELSIWTDVDGVMSADPNRVPESQVIDALSYNEAMELAYFGAKVLHPQTLGPVLRNGIPLVIRNTFNPDAPGSRITTDGGDGDNIKGVTAVRDMALVSLEGSGMIGVPGTAERLFAALRDAGVSVTLISQASSEHSISVAVPRQLAERAARVIREAFAVEIEGGQIQRVAIDDDQSIIAVVGDGMAGEPGIAARFFGNLANARINIRAIAQGSSERNISAVVKADDVTRALRAAHSGFYLSKKTISVGLIGPGTVGATLIDQINQQRERLESDFGLDLRLRAIARSSQMCLADRRIDLDDWRGAFADSAEDLDLDRFEHHVAADHLPHAVIVDCTASDEIAARYAGWLRNGIHVVTPNKKAFSGPLERLREIRDAARETGAHYFYETTVGAALPVIMTLKDLVHTGDHIHSVQGIFSGTLAYLFNVYDGSEPFSRILREAKESGYTEPDPRDDLSGTDVARKLIILARELGAELELGDFPVASLVPEALRDVSVDEYLDRLPEFDADMQALFEKAEKHDRKLRYLAHYDAAGKASVALEEVAADSAFANIDLTDNIVQFASTRYSANPLVIQGPGAGPAVTAGGIFGDLLKLANYLGDGSYS